MAINDIKAFKLNQTLEKLTGPTKEQIIVNNQWAAVAFDKFHKGSKAIFKFSADSVLQEAIVEWDSSFSKSAMKEKIDMANHGGVAMAMFVMSVLLDYAYLEQSEIGDGVDYRFMKSEPDEDDLNFLNNYHYAEVSGILEELGSNTLKKRIKDKHEQIKSGGKKDEPSSVIVTLFSEPITVKEIHK